MGLPAAKSGLAERRAMKDFADNILPGLIERIHQAARTTLEVEFDWESMYYQGADCSYWGENMAKVFFEPTISSLESICSDDMGKDALHAKVKRIKFINSGSFGKVRLSIDNDTLVFDHSPDSNVDYGHERVKELTTFLESSL